MNVAILGAGSTYGVFLVKWALHLKHDPKSNREKVTIPEIGTVAYSNTTERNKDLVMEVLEDELFHMALFSKSSPDSYLKDVHGYTNWREMLSKESPGLVIIGSPLATHIPYLRELLLDFKVKNILCEPPLCHLHEMEALPNVVQLAQEKNVNVGVNQQYATFYERLREVPLNPNQHQKQNQNSQRFGSLLSGVEALHITFITHGTRLWRRMQGVGEQEILEDLGPHVFELIPESIRNEKVVVKNVKKEGDNLFLNFVEYELLLGKVPVRITLGYHRKLKSLKLVFRKEKKDYEFHISGATNPDTGEYTRWIEGKNYAYPFKHFLDTDLVKASFISSLAGKPVVPIHEGAKSLEFIKALYSK